MIAGISSMATRTLLAELATAFQQKTGITVAFESVGGVDAARRVQAGEAFDVVVLASDAIGKLMMSGHVLANSKTDLVHSVAAIAVREGASHPDISTETALKQAVLAAKTIGYSTGPSGTALLELFKRWGIADVLRPRIVQASAGSPVGQLVASGEVELGFQQLSELIGVRGVDVLGLMPPGCVVVTTFTAGICAASRQQETVRKFLDYLCSPEANEIKNRNHMVPV